MLINEEELKRMGKGWFILKYAQEHGVAIKTSLEYGTEKAMKTRESAYDRTKSFHDKMIVELKKTDIQKSTRAGSPELNSTEIKRILLSL